MQAKIKIIKLTRKKNSYVGNPAWDIVGVTDGYNDFNGVVMAAYIESRKEIKTWNI